MEDLTFGVNNNDLLFLYEKSSRSEDKVRLTNLGHNKGKYLHRNIFKAFFGEQKYYMLKYHHSNQYN